MIRTAMDGQEDPGRFPSVAILGLSGRFPGARSPSEFWYNLRAGREAINGFCEPHPGSTREAAEWARGAASVHVGGPLAEAAGFDAAFFGMSVAAASALTAEQRLFLECAWEAFEHAGYVGERVPGPVAVFAAPGPHASGLSRFATAFQSPGPSAGSSERDQPSDRRGLSTLVSRQLNLTGPSLDVHAAGASSLAAVHLACQSLLNAECDMALAGGSTVHPDGETHCGAYGAENLSPDGHCRPFEARAAGTVLASGVACVVLKRLEDAVRDGDQILAVIRGSAINNAGEPRAGDTAPGLAGQVRAVSEALAMAGVQPEEISYIEAHGAGTRSGDAIEILALTKAFRARTAQRRFCAVGSVKGNIGHTGEAAGIAGLVKVVLALQNRQIPASLHVERPNPEANFGDSPFYVNTSLRDWTVPPGQRRIAGVTALGEGGTNAHLVVEEAPDPPPPTPSRAHHILVLSARTPAALETLTDTLAEQLRTAPDTNLADVSYTLLAGRKPWPYRRVVVARDAADAVHALTPDASGRAIASTYTGRQPSSVVWLFPGSGYYAGMGAGLAACEPAYRHALDDALSTLDPDLEAAVRGLVCQPPAASGNRPAEGPARTLPALVAVQYAIGCQLQTWGIPPSGMMGEGVGEYTAACFAGVFDIGQAMALAAFEGRLLEGSASGTGEGPVQAPPADAAIEDPRFGELERFCRAMPFKAPARPLISNATGAWITSVEAADPAFWARRPRSSRGAEGIQTLLTLRDAVFVEIGPGAFAMSPPAQSSSAPAVVACTIRPPDKPDSDVAFLLNAVGRLWAAGVPVEASKLFPGEQRRRVGLGTYPFERQRRWSDPGSQAPSPAAAGPTARPDMADWFLWPAWERSIPPPASALPSSWLVLTDDSPLAADIVAGLRDSDHRVATVKVGSGFALVAPDSYTVDPGNLRDYEALARALQESDQRPQRVLHLWAMAPRGTGCGGDSDEDCEPDVHYRDGLALDYFSLLHLTRTFAAATSELRVYCVSTQVQAVAPGDEVHPRKAVLLGPCLVSPREYPGVSCTSIDIDWPVTASQRRRLLDHLARELRHVGTECEIALRGRDRWIRRYAPARLPAATPQQWVRAGGTYVIVGDLGGFAFPLAEHLATNGPVKLALIVPTRAPGHASDSDVTGDESTPGLQPAATLRRLRALGAEMLTLEADLADRDSGRRALTEVTQRLGAIDGLFHVPKGLDRPTSEGGEGSLATPVLDAGLQTALALDELLSEAPFSAAPLDLFVLFSSAGPRPGFPGRSESTAASVAIDRLAHARSQRSPGRTLSINWSVWPDPGTLTDGVDVRQSLGREPNGPAGTAPGPGITAAQGLAALDRMLAVESGPQIMVSPAAVEPPFDDLPPATGSGNRSHHDGVAERPPVSVGRPQTPLLSAPLADIERDLAAMWREALQLDEVGVREDYFELGGHSLGAVRLFGRIRSAFGVDLPLATLFEAPTIADLAVLLRDRMAGVTPSPSGARTRHGTAVSSAASPTLLRSLVAVQPGAEGTPLFVVHGAGGNVLNVRDLARAMGRTRAVFGLQASGIDGISAPGESIEQMAQSYLDEIRFVQPRGPYLLVGYSGGGIIAFEMARRLEAAGEAIGVLALVDTFHPQMLLPQVNASTRLERLRREGMSYVRAAVERLRRSRRDARDARRIEEHLAAGEPIPLALRELHLIRNFDRAAHRYSPSAWTGKALLFKAEEVDYYYQAGGPAYGWDNTVLGGIEIIPIPGDHDSIMVGANAARIAQRLVQVVDEVTSRDQDRRE